MKQPVVTPTVTQIPCGLTVATIQAPCKNLFYIELVVKKGILHQNRIGLAHFIEHLMSFFPSETYPDSLENQKLLDSHGIETNAWTSDTSCGYFLSGLERYTHLMLDLLFYNYTERFTTQSGNVIDNSIFEQERSAVLKELDRIVSDTWYPLDKCQMAALFGNTPLECSVEHERESVKRFTREDVLEFWCEFYRPENVVVLICGNDIDGVDQYIHNTYFSHLPLERGLLQGVSQGGFSQEIPSPKITPKTVHFVQTGTDLYKLRVAFRVPFGPFDENYVYALDAITLILTQGMASRLYARLRGDLGAIYHVSADTSFNELDSSYNWYTIETECSQACLPHVIHAILDETMDFSNVTPEETQQYHDTIDKDHITFECSSGFMKLVEFYRDRIVWTPERGFPTPEDVFAQRRNITSHDIVTVAQNVFHDPKIFYAGPQKILSKGNNKFVTIG